LEYSQHQTPQILVAELVLEAQPLTLLVQVQVQHHHSLAR
jgi:hypothetical protein